MQSGQQWDRPNGWAPLQWVAINGVAAYGGDGLARDIARRWLRRNIDAYEESGVLLEKYDVEERSAIVVAVANIHCKLHRREHHHLRSVHRRRTSRPPLPCRVPEARPGTRLSLPSHRR